MSKETSSKAPGHFIALPDGKVHYELVGSDQAQTVVLVPGMSVPYLIWTPTFRTLASAGFRVLRYDLFGRGYSDRPDLVYDQDLFDRQLWDLLAALGIKDRIDLVGLSLGGAISVIFTDRHPGSVRKLCLIDPAGLPWEGLFPLKVLEVPVLGEFIMGIIGGRVLLAKLDDYLRGNRGKTALVQGFQEQMRYPGFKRALLSTLRSGMTTAAEKAYRRVGEMDIPILLIWGREDKIVPFGLSERVKELLPPEEFHAIDGAAHIPHFERPEVVNPILIDFLKG